VFSGLNRASNINVAFRPGLGFKIRPVYVSEQHTFTGNLSMQYHTRVFIFNFKILSLLYLAIFQCRKVGYVETQRRTVII